MTGPTPSSSSLAWPVGKISVLRPARAVSSRAGLRTPQPPAQGATMLLSASHSAPANHAAAITPCDSAPLANNSRFIMAAVTGVAVVDTVGGEIAVVVPVTNKPLPLHVSRIYATGTTAIGIMVLW